MTAILIFLALTAAVVAFLGYAGAYVALSGGKRIPLTIRPGPLGLPYEAVEFRTRDGLTLKGWFIPADPVARRTIIFCHGWGGNKGEVLRGTHRLRDEGFNLFYFDFRCCGESEGDLLSVGVLEAADFDAALEFLRSRRPDDSIAVYGMSMGAMVAFGGLVRHPFLKAAVLESPFESHNQALARYAWAKFWLSYYPFMPMISFWVERRLGVDPEAISPERLAGRVGGTPFLVLCGEKDSIATPEIGRSLLEKVPGPKELWIVPGAGHGQCAERGGREYQERLARFYCAHL